ncbi:YrhC family protein [Lentibacillus salinarum]|uniref:YrhC family protein n=1 Tax=Lentibacillus salinarum TaxID=446820 RepID=A0ABW3ZX34_9BACI
MKHQGHELEAKLKDYRRFTATLLILASYLYMGAIINTYIHYSSDGKGLIILAFLTAVMAGWFARRTYQLIRNRLK